MHTRCHTFSLSINKRFKGCQLTIPQREKKLGKHELCFLCHILKRHVPRGEYRQRITACFPRLVMAEKSGRKHLGNSQDIFTRCEVYRYRTYTRKTFKVEWPGLESLLQVARPPRYQMHCEIITAILSVGGHVAIPSV